MSHYLDPYIKNLSREQLEDLVKGLVGLITYPDNYLDMITHVVNNIEAAKPETQSCILIAADWFAETSRGLMREELEKN